MLPEHINNTVKEFLQREQYSDCIVFLEQDIEEFSDQTEYYWYLGLVYLLQEQLQEALNVWLTPFLALDQNDQQSTETLTEQLIKFLEAEIQNNIQLHRLGNAKIIYEAILVVAPDYHNQPISKQLIQALLDFAKILVNDDEQEAAIAVYHQILDINDDHAETIYLLAVSYYYLENYSDAEKIIAKAINLNDKSSKYYLLQGQILEALKHYHLAKEAYKKAIKFDPSSLNFYDQLANLCCQHFDLEDAIIYFVELLEIVPAPLKVIICNKISQLYQQYNHQAFSLLYQGYAAHFSEKNYEALSYFKRFEETGSEDQKSFELLARCYLHCNRPTLAINILNKALEQNPNDPLFRRLNQLVLPVLYQTVDEIDYYRHRFSALLDDLISQINFDTAETKNRIAKSLHLPTNFHLGYQGKNDLELQIKYARYMKTIITGLFPQWFLTHPKQRQSNSSDKIRIGYFSSRLFTLGRLYVNWLKYADKDRFEIYVYDYSGKSEAKLLHYQKLFKQYADHFNLLPTGLDINDLRNRILCDNLDVLMLPEIGIEPLLDILATFRLAPIQCTTWAHPLTSGSSCIDYFLSSDLMEPEQGDQHYAEKLIRLPNLGFSLPTPTVPVQDKKRSDFNLREDAVVYLCCQSLFKYLPQHDYLFAEIAKQSQTFQFIFLDPAHGRIVTEDFQHRLDKVFSHVSLDYRQYCIFLPRTNKDEYLKLNQLSDVFLDCLSWSGGLTTRHAIACGVPVVTCPGELMRARHSYGILQMLGITETIAQNEGDYIDIAVRLGLDSEWRQQLKNRILKDKDRIFEDRDCVLGLESFFKQVVNGQDSQ